MENGNGRRTLLQRGLALIAGGAAAAGGWGFSRRDASSGSDRQLVVYGRRRPADAPGAGLVSAGELLDAPDGKAIGEFYTNSFGLAAPHGPQPAAAEMEFQILQLKNGSLFSMRGGASGKGRGPAALIGGTAHFAGRTGAVVERVVASEWQGRDLVEFVITFA